MFLRPIYLLLRAPEMLILQGVFLIITKTAKDANSQEKYLKAIVSSVQSAIVLYKHHFLAPLRPGLHIRDLNCVDVVVQKATFYCTKVKEIKPEFFERGNSLHIIRYRTNDLFDTVRYTSFGFRPKSKSRNLTV